MKTPSHSIVYSAFIAAAVLGLSACDVKKTESGNVSLPKYEVEKTKEGDVTLPKYSVTTPDVKVESVKKEVTVPKVVMEKETVTVPEVQVTPAKKQ